MKVFTILLSVLFIAGFSGKMRSQGEFKGKRYTFEVVDSKNPEFSEADLIKDMSSLTGVFKCKYVKDKKLFAIYATSQIPQVDIHMQLMKHRLGYTNFAEKILKLDTIEADTYETK